MTETETDAPPRPPSRGHGTREVWFAWVEAAYRPLHAAGLDDTRAAAELGVSRMATSACRVRLGLPHNDSPGRRAHGRAFGLRNVGRRVYDPAAYGLPAGLYAPQVRIVLALADGPRTAASLGTCPGLTYAEIRAGNNRAGLRWMPDLEARGLIGRTHRGGRVPVTYFLTAAALAALSSPGTETPNADA